MQEYGRNEAEGAAMTMPPTTLPGKIARRLRNLRHPNVEVLAAPPGISVDWDVPVKVRDGTTLRVNVFRPADGAVVPVIMSAHPYGKDRIPAKTRSKRGLNPQYRVFFQPEVIRLSEYTSWEAPDPAFWVPRGYAVINADLRGGGTSEGVGELFSDQEALDYYDLIEWAAVQPWSSGRVGLDGVSYLAMSQYKVAALRPPHLAAICPWEGFSDLYRDFTRPGGTREDGFSVMWSRLTRLAARMKTDVRKEVVARPNRDAWYASLTPELERIEVPMLVCGSFSDHSLHTRGSFEAFRRAASPLKQLYTHRGGKWSTYYGDEAAQARARFFDHALKGIDNGAQSDPAVRLAVYEGGPDPVAVRGESDWPPSDLTRQKLALDVRARALVEEQPAQAGTLAFDVPRGSLHFDWTVPHDMDVIGPMVLRLHVELQGGGDASLFVGVRKFRDGREVTFEGSYGFSGDMMTKGWQRLAHHARDERLSTPWLPVYRHDVAEPLAAGEVRCVDIALLPQATRLRKGDRLRLDVRGKWHYSRNPFTGQFPVGYQHGPKAACSIHAGGANDSYLTFGSRPFV
jgi:predicted acyl esterase